MSTELLWITVSGLLMAGIALVGSITLVLKPSMLDRVLLPLVAFAAGSLIGGALFHMLPAALERTADSHAVFGSAAVGFALFLALEQFMHWHHCHAKYMQHKEPSTYLILVADGLHNLLGGLAVGGVFMVDIELGLMAWIAAAMHEVPQELGDLAVLVDGGWRKGRALLFNFLSGLTFLVGGWIAYFAAAHLMIDTDPLIAFGAGNFLYIAASDLIPRINRQVSVVNNAIHYAAFCMGLALLYMLARL